MTFHVNKSDPGHKRLDQRITKNAQTTFVTTPQNAVEIKNVKKKKRKTIAKLFALQANAIQETSNNNRN